MTFLLKTKITIITLYIKKKQIFGNLSIFLHVATTVREKKV